MKYRRRDGIILAVMLLLVTGGARASVHNIHLHTDSTPDFVSIEDFVTTATSAWEMPEDKAIALWRWMVRSHLQSSATSEDGAPIWEPMRFYGSYPNTYCGYMAAFLTSFADAMGGDWRHRYIELPDHTVCELSWDAGATWHLFDPSMVVYVRNHEGGIASCAEVAAPGNCELSEMWGAAGQEAGHLYLYHTTQECMTNPPDPDHADNLAYPVGYRKACEKPVEYARTLRNGADSYTSGYETQTSFTHVRRGWTNRLHLRPGHAYTRYWAPLGEGAEFARLDTHGEDPNDSSPPANIRSNGLWEVAPGFAAWDPSAGWHELSGVIHRNDDPGPGPLLRTSPGQAQGRLVVKIDGANVLTSGRLFLAGECGAGDTVRLEVSRDAGCHWTPVQTLPAGNFDGWRDLPASLIGGTHELLVRIVLEPDDTRMDCGLNDLRLEAFTQLNRMTLPTLQRGANRVRFEAGPAVETLTLRPSLHAGAQHHWTLSADSHSGLLSRSDAGQYNTAIVVPETPGQPGVATWRVEAPTDIVSFRFGGSLLCRYPGPSEKILLKYSWDGQQFQTGAVFDATSAPTWDGRLYVAPDFVPAGASEVWLQFEIHSAQQETWLRTGLQEILLEVDHAALEPGFTPLEVTWNWTEHRVNEDRTRQHTRIVGSAQEIWDVNVAGYRDPTLNWLRVRESAGSVPEGYSDGQDVGPDAGYDKRTIHGAWLDDVALGKTYTATRPSAGVNPDAGGVELTDGVVIPPTTHSTSVFVDGQVAYWAGDDPLGVTIDLEQERTIAALRVTSHQPNNTYGHAGTITARAFTAGGAVTTLGVIQHDDIFNPQGDHLDWGFHRSHNYDGLPALGRLAYGYWLVFDEPVSAREVQLDMVPLAGHGLGLSEIQVFSAVTEGDWPDREVDLGGFLSAVDEDAPVPEARPRVGIHPNPFNGGTVVRYEVPAFGSVTVRIVDLRGRVVRTLVQGRLAEGTHRAFWDSRDDRGRSVASGAYFAVVEAGGVRSVGRVTLVR